MRSLDLPDQPDEPSRAGHDGAGEADRLAPKPRELADPDERSRVYDATQAHVSAETGDWAEQGRRPDGAEQSGYWAQVPRFRDMWADHESRWPERQSTAAADRLDDPPGSYRSDGGFYLNPERHAETVDAIGRVRKAEPAISADALAVERENKHGGRLEGFDRRLKGDDRVKEKVAEQLAAEPDKTSSEVLRKVPDAIRLTFSFEPERYTRGYYDIKERLENRGYEMRYSRNWWTDPEYKGINTRWMTAQGQRFEVQFHTPESFHAKHYVTHKAYERLRNPQIADDERRKLEDFQREVSSHIQVPDGATDIPDFRKEGF